MMISGKVVFAAHFAEPPNGWRYPLVGGTRQRHSDGNNSKPRETPEIAQTPTSRVHALLGGVSIYVYTLLGEPTKT
jgi:hypothetical protein